MFQIRLNIFFFFLHFSGDTFWRSEIMNRVLEESFRKVRQLEQDIIEGPEDRMTEEISLRRAEERARRLKAGRNDGGMKKSRTFKRTRL